MNAPRAAVTELPRLERPTREQFQEEFFKPQKPVVITGAIADWPALQKWTPEYFLANAPKKNARAEVVKAQPGTPSRFPYWANLGARFKTGPLDEMIKYIIEQSKKPDGDSLYLQGMSIKEDLSACFGDILPPQYIEPKLPYMTNLWFGTGGIVPLHFDPQQNLLVQIAGTKDITLCPPLELDRFYPHRMYTDAHQTSQVNDIYNPDFTRFPRFRDVPLFHTVLTPGDMIFIPCYWWHQVHTDALAIAVNLWYGAGAKYMALHRYGPRVIVGSLMNLGYNLVTWNVKGTLKSDTTLSGT